MKKRRLISWISFFVITCSMALSQTPTVFEINKSLGKGINMGNMFESPSEGEWGNPFREDYFQLIAALGFNHVRIPIRWDVADRTQQTPPYTINPVFMERIKYVIDKALAENLYVIINMHHHDAIFQDPDGVKARFISQWTQIATYFKSYDHRLLFEVMNEPNSNLTPQKWNTFFKDALTEIRKTNPTRAVLMGTDPWGGLAGVPDLVFPTDDYLILTIHYYEPFSFTHQGAEWVSGSEPWLGTKWENTDLERNEVINSFAFAQALAKAKNIPIHVGEFGAYSRADIDSRVKWSNFLARWFESQGFSWAYWEWSAGFGIYNPTTNQYLTPLANALLTDPMAPPKPQTKIVVFEGSFAPGDGWNLSVQPTAAAVLTKANGTGTIDITKASTEGWHIQLTRSPITLKKDSRYQVTIKASSDIPVSITNYLGKNSDPWNSYSGYKSISLSSALSEFIYSFQMTSPTDNLARIAFDLGTKVAKINIASIKIEEVKDVVSAYAETWNDRIKLSPNPVKDHLTITGIHDFNMLRILDMQGRLIRQFKQSGSTVNVADLGPGMYAVEVRGDKGWGVKMMVKE